MRIPAALSLLLLSACGFVRGCEDERFPITYVDIKDNTADDKQAPAKLDRPKLERSIGAAIETWPDFAFRSARAGERKWQLDVSIEYLRERSAIPEGDEDAALLEGKKRRVVEVAMRRFPLSGGVGATSIQTLVTYAENVDPGVDFDEVARRAIFEAAASITVMEKLREEDPDALVARLDTADEKLKKQILQLIQERKIAEAVPKLMVIVRDEKEKDDVVLLAIGGLVAIGDVEAVPALIDAGRRRSPAYLAQILYALGALGGRDAQGYLFTVQSGHPNPALREVAKEALEELESRAQKEP